MNQPAMKYCSACAAPIDSRAEICPKCGVRQHGPLATEADSEVRQAAGNKIAAGICGIMLGAFGIHKFILGLTTPGIIMLLATITCVGYPVMHIIGIIEGIIYLSKSDEDFYQTYIVEKKGWF